MFRDRPSAPSFRLSTFFCQRQTLPDALQWFLPRSSMRIEGLWTVEFDSDDGYVGAGVVVLSKNRDLGGDNQYVYTGTYELSGLSLTAHVDAVAFCS